MREHNLYIRLFQTLPKPLGRVYARAGFEPAIKGELNPVAKATAKIKLSLKHTRWNILVHCREKNTEPKVILQIQYIGNIFIYHGKKVANSIRVRNFFAFEVVLLLNLRSYPVQLP